MYVPVALDSNNIVLVVNVKVEVTARSTESAEFLEKRRPITNIAY